MASRADEGTALPTGVTQVIRRAIELFPRDKSEQTDRRLLIAHLSKTEPWPGQALT